MIIAMASTHEWYHYLVVDLFSLLKNNKSVKEIYLFVETEDISEIKNLDKLREKFKVKIKLINFLKIRDKYLKKECPNTNTVYTDLCFCKLMLADFISHDRVIYLDTDAIVRKDISSLWNLNLEDNYAAGCKDYGVIVDKVYYEPLGIKGKYINSGVVLFNLKKIREELIINQWFEIVNTRSLDYPDQDALNLICNEAEIYIPSLYNYICDVTKEVMNLSLVKVFHYAGPKLYWLADRFCCEEWYDAEEQYYNEIK